MDDADEITIRPNYPGLLLSIGLLGVGVFLPALLLSKLLQMSSFGPELFDWVITLAAIVICVLLLLGSLVALLDSLYVLFTGLRPSLAVRISRQGIHFPERHEGVIPWHLVRDVRTHDGYNGKNIWFLLDPSLPLRGYSILDRIHNIGVEERVNYLRLQSHQYSFSAPELLQKLRGLAPEGMRMAYHLN